jgi:hypothetical protein
MVLTSWLPNAETHVRLLQQAAKRVSDMRVILTNENATECRERELSDYGEGYRFTLNSRMSQFLDSHVRYAQFPPHILAMIIDDTIYSAPMLFQKQAMECLAFKCSERDPAGRHIIDHFEGLWVSSREQATPQS